ncbi:MAG TPA: NADP-dependent oxidoreductase [Thermoanaerobaculia bacterium]|jgi:NADPH-dependent curcumin reductase CurA|nr:NADP-dependent oxidoreductase [Thermoanaerobaculia bacterium]
MNTQILLKSRPQGMPDASHFETVEIPIPEAGAGQVLRRTIWLSVDPYMRGRMSEAKSYAAPAKLGEPMVGATVSQVIASNSPRFAPGDFVLGYDGWQAYGVGDAKLLRALDPAVAPVSYALGVLGMPGLTAYVGLLDIGQPKSGETVVISAAAGAVGSIAGQIAKIHGCRVIGTAGSDEKCEYVTRDLGFDACINYKTEDIGAALDAAAPNGIDIYYDNVGGAVLDAVLQRVNVHARIALVGLISQYNDAKPTPGPNLSPLLSNRVLMRGMIISDHQHRAPDFLRDMSDWLRDGKIHYREDIITGLENTVIAFLGLFAGENVGKRIVKVAEPE